MNAQAIRKIPKVYLGVRVSAEVKEELQARSIEEERSVGQVVDRALRSYLGLPALKRPDNGLHLNSPKESGN
jgi:hypothetical protein